MYATRPVAVSHGHATVCSARNSRERRSVITRFRIRQPAEGIPTEVELKEPEAWRTAVASPSAAAPPRRRQAVASTDGEAEDADARSDKRGPAAAEGPSSPWPRRGLVREGLDSVGVLAGNLLMNAASWRVVRGQTYCLHCRGTGRETCTACQGSGILEPEKVRMNQIRHAAGKLQVLLGVSDARMHDSTWMKSNRCKRCHGTGALPCKQCNGTGVLGAPPGN